jgi:hypothetical protein
MRTIFAFVEKFSRGREEDMVLQVPIICFTCPACKSIHV